MRIFGREHIDKVVVDDGVVRVNAVVYEPEVFDLERDYKPSLNVRAYSKVPVTDFKSEAEAVEQAIRGALQSLATAVDTLQKTPRAA